jgi:hypothetical protein
MIKNTKRLNTKKACLFTSRAELVWRSPAWDEIVGEPGSGRLNGAQWHEYILPDDHDYVLAWFAAEKPGEPCIFRFMVPAGGRWVCCIFAKRRWRGLWLVIGDALEVVGMPPPPSHPQNIEPPKEGHSCPKEGCARGDGKERGGGLLGPGGEAGE